uniref:protein acetyllysine N-acetyltransferase n=1 Tax=Glossina brevipalpis TaxID=37001 RepID=A0A1A9WKZ9_9MUSC
MMENYDQPCIKGKSLPKLSDDVLPVKLQEQNDFFTCVEELAVHNKQNFNFGAEILNTANLSVTSETDSKTNYEINKTLGTSEHNLQTSIAVTTNAVVCHNKDSKDCLAETISEQDCNDQDVDEEEEEEDSYQTDENDNSSNNRIMSRHHDHDINDENLEDSDESSSDSDFSDLSGLSDMSGKEWKPKNQRPINWVQKQIHSGANPRELLSKFLPTSAQRIAPELTDMTLWRILASMLSEPPRRQKLSYINTFDDVIQLLQKCNNIIVLTGAGVSVSCGIPDFRSSDGIYSRLAKDFPDLPDPQAMFDISYFSRDPRPFYKFAREIYPGQFKPSPCHHFIKMLQEKNKLLRNYTQNIDTLEQVAGIQNVIECHGSFSTASCTKCKYKCDADSIRADIFAQRIPVCPRCQPNVEQSVDASQPVSEFELRRLVENGIMKPDIVFFGEGLPDEFHTVMASDKDKCDLLIVMGSSLKVRPVALIPSSIPANVPQILINREQLHHLEFDVELLGDGDVIINQICHRLGEDWQTVCFNDEILEESKELMPLDEEKEAQLDESICLATECEDEHKSNNSIELTMRSTGTYSDSGFDSSSSTTALLAPKKVEFLSPDLIEEPEASTSFSCSRDYRYLSIDSSKDSGIQGDGSNQALPLPLNALGDTGGTRNDNYLQVTNMGCSTSTMSTATSLEKICKERNTETIPVNNPQEPYMLKCRPQHPPPPQQSAADRLFKGTYYCHDGRASYVFPGAQVTWCTDSNEAIEDDLAEQKVEEFEDSDTNQAPLSPLMTPSVEAEMVNAITSTKSHQLTANTISTTTTTAATTTTTTTTNFNNVINASSNRNSSTCLALNKQKRSSNAEEENIEFSCIKNEPNNSQTISCNNDMYPPSKKRRSSNELLNADNEFNEQINNIKAQENPNLECSSSFNYNKL